MHRAREKASGRPVFRRHIGPPHRFDGPLICWKCAAPVVAVKQHIRLGTRAPAKFRLAPHTEHEFICPLNPTAVAEHIAHGSQGLADVSERGILRLNLPEKLTDIPPALDGDEPIETETIRHTVRTVRPMLPPAVGTAAAIARFLHLHDFDPEIVSRFKVRPHGGRLINWDAFCYGPGADSLAALYERCRPGAPLTSPVAVVGTVERISHDRQERPFAMLALNVTTPAGDRFHVAVRSPHSSLIEPLSAGTHLLAVGAGWSVFDGGHTPTLRLFAEEHWQLAYWTTHDDKTTAPRSPQPITAAERARTSPRTSRGRLSPTPPSSFPRPAPSPTPRTASVAPPPGRPQADSTPPQPPEPASAAPTPPDPKSAHADMEDAASAHFTAPSPQTTPSQTAAARGVPDVSDGEAAPENDPGPGPASAPTPLPSPAPPATAVSGVPPEDEGDTPRTKLRRWLSRLSRP